MGKNLETIQEQVLSGLAEYRGFYSQEYYLDFENRISRLREQLAAAQEEGRLLKIGIVGEVKAGKSSFLNALIFQGEDILPKAGTPMTAALTKISYSPQPMAKIVFYSRKDWEVVEGYAEEYEKVFEEKYQEYLKKAGEKRSALRKEGTADEKTREEMRKGLDEKIPLKLKACRELLNMSRNNGIDVEAELGTEHVIKSSNFKEELNQYIGAQGRYTSIVKHVELQIDNPFLEGIEIVDTPGLNDPILSRGETTKNFLRECDVIFLLSYSGQFLTQEDISFMRNTLPREGIRNVVLVGSKFDSGILDNNKTDSIKTAYNASKHLYDNQAKDNIAKCMESGRSMEVFQKMQSALPPDYISSMLYSCAVRLKNGEGLSEEQQHILNRLQESFKDFDRNPQFLLSLSGIEQLKKNRLIPIMQQKKEIIEEKNRNLLQDNRNVLLKILEDIHIQILQNRENLKNYDKDGLEKKLDLLQSKLNGMRSNVRNIFDLSAVEAASALQSIALEVDSKRQEHGVYFDVQEETHVEYWEEKKWLGLKKVRHKDEITVKYVDVSDSLAIVENYITDCEKLINKGFSKVIDLNGLKRRIIDSVSEAFDMSDKDFDENDILIPIEIAIKNLRIPDLDIDKSSFLDLILDSFDGRAEGSEISNLKAQTRAAMGKSAEAMKRKLRDYRKKVEQMMAEQSATFVDGIISQLTGNVEKLSEQLADKENNIRRYDELVEKLGAYKKSVQGMEL